jgi:DnaK suppressor protein
MPFSSIAHEPMRRSKRHFKKRFSYGHFILQVAIVMKKNKLTSFEDILLKKRKTIQASVEQLRESTQSKEEDTLIAQRFDTDIADQGSDSMDREKSFLFISRELQYLSRIEEALKRIKHGTYGICTRCGNEIPEERLEAVPTAHTCVKCKTVHAEGSSVNE